jgi:hypothetical protein
MGSERVRFPGQGVACPQSCSGGLGVWGGPMEWVHRLPAVSFPCVTVVILVLPDVLHGWSLKGDETLSFKEVLSIALANALVLASLAYAPWSA